jgi:U3 small nucleolar RNA-associated protein 22
MLQYPEMRPIQLFRMTLLSFSKLLIKDGLRMQQASDLAAAASHQKPPLSRAWQTIGQEVVFIDMSGWLNLAASMSAAALQQAQYAASNTAALLSTSMNSEALDRLFLRRQPLAILYDSWFRIRLQPESNGVDGQFNTETLPWQDYDAKIEAIAKKGLRARAKLVRVIRRTAVLSQGDDTDFDTCFADGSKVHAGPDRGEVLLGVRLDPTMAYKTVDVGPAAEKKALAAEFRSFWGEKAELRRFQDGKIAESVVWDVSPAEVHGIVANIIRYVIHRHVSASARIFEITTALDGALLRKGHTAEDDIIAERLINSATTQLGKRLRAMDDANLPLKVISAQPLSPVSRHAAVFPPLPHPLAGASTATVKESLADDGVIPRCLEPIEILCKLEGTGKWPDDPTAYLKTKAAIGVQLAKALHSKHGLYAQAAEDYIDVLSDGFAFRLLLITERESGGSIGDVGFRDLLDLRVWQQGLVSQTSGVNPSFAPALRLAKRWISSQWLSPHVCEEAVELLMVAVYSDVHVNGGAASLPASPVAGFLQFLILLAEHPWNLMPFVLPTNDMEERSRIDAAQTSRSADSYLAYDKLKASNAAPAMYIVGPQPEKCVLWTENHPSRAVLHRAIVLARRASQLIKSVVIGEGLNGAVNISNTPALAPENLVEAIFAHDECEYDILIRLRKEALPRVNQIEIDRSEQTPKSRPSWTVLQAPEVSKDIAKKTRAVLSGIPIQVLKSRGGAHVRKELLIGFEPVELYVEQLMQRFSSVGVVCADYCGGARVGIKLFGNILKPGPVRPEVAHVLKPEDSRKQGSHRTVMDVVSIAEDAISLGAGLVERVEYKHPF